MHSGPVSPPAAQGLSSMSGHHRSQLLPPLCRCLQAAEASPEEGGLGSRYAFRQRFYSTLPPTLDNELRVRFGGRAG